MAKSFTHNYNQMAFTPEQVKKGLHLELIAALEKIEEGLGDRHFDILRTSDGYCTIILWCDVNDDGHYESGTFRFVDSDECVMIQREYPDGHYEYFQDEEEYDDALARWLRSNPGWSKDSYGRWYYTEPSRSGKNKGKEGSQDERSES